MRSPGFVMTGAVSVVLSWIPGTTLVAGEAVSTSPVLKRIAVVGASVSGGFGLEAEVGGRVVLADALDAAVSGEHAPVVSAAERLFFIDPSMLAEKSVSRVLKARPTLVVAVDFLFWFGYGTVAREADRLTRLEEGLAYLERFSCPCVVGDIPDMSAAIGTMLAARQVPKKETLRRLNDRIRQWAKKRKDAATLSLSAFMETLRAGKTVRLGAYAGTREVLLQQDQLHTTLEGTAYLAAVALDTVRRARTDIPTAAVCTDPRKIARAVRAAVQKRSGRAAE